jgi:hypothetical protein
MNHDPLFVVNSKIECPFCEGNRRKRRSCAPCKGTGFQPIDMCGMWGPSAGFYVCGGPSINKIPYHRLSERGIVSLGVNNVAGHVPVNAMCFGDPQTKFHHGIHLDPKCITFAPTGKLRKRINAKLPDGTFRLTDTMLCECPSVFGISRTALFDAKNFFKTDYAMWGRGGNQPEEDTPFRLIDTMLVGMRLMHYMGCPRVYLLGVDFNMKTGQPYSFEQKKKGRNGRYKKMNAMLHELLPTFEAEGFEVFNCNPDSECDAFPYVSFEDAMDDCRGAVPELPFDLSLWYDKHVAKEHIENNPVQITQTEIAQAQREAVDDDDDDDQEESSYKD